MWRNLFHLDYGPYASVLRWFPYEYRLMLLHNELQRTERLRVVSETHRQQLGGLADANRRIASQIEHLFEKNRHLLPQQVELVIKEITQQLDETQRFTSLWLRLERESFSDSSTNRPKVHY